MSTAPGSRAQLYPALYVTAELIAILGYASASSRFRWLFFIPIAVICIYLIFYTTTGNLASDYSFGGAITALFFTTSDFLVLNPDIRNELKPSTSTRKQLGLLKSSKEKAREDDGGISLEAGWWDRFCWALKLRFNPRGVGWTHEAPSTQKTAPLPKKRSGSRTSFVLTRLFEGALNAIILDICTVGAKENPSFVKGGSLLEAGWAWRTVSVFQFVGMTYCSLRMMHSFLSAAFVGTRISDPEDWPPLFGKLGEAYTVRRFWG